MELQNESDERRLMAREVQVYTSTSHTWRDAVFSAETRYRPCVYVARLSVRIDKKMPEEDREALQETLLRILDERLKVDFKRMIEDTEESDGFLETGALNKLSDRFSRYVERAVKRFSLKQWEIGID
ncbi:MAG: hypothetical protein HGB19_12165 [Chlorobiales bacterium]|jgi:hypothetical protein|nr:hypothetical protein [Chlorobiales bacterium]